MALPSMKGLQALSVLSRTASLSAAATSLGVTRSALSHRIAELERQVGVSMVRQSGRCAVLTDDAEALLLVMGDALERIEAAIEPFQRRRSQLRISTVGTFASHWLIPRLADWQTSHPNIDLAISTSTRVVDLRTEDFDCALRHGLGGWKGLTSTLIFHETLVPVAGPGADPSIHPDSRLIRAKSRFRDWSRWWKLSGRPGKPPERGLIVETRAQALDAALAGMGIAMMDMAYAAPRLAKGDLLAVGAVVDLKEGYHLVHSARPRNPEALAQLREWLVRQDHGEAPAAHVFPPAAAG